MLDNPFDLSDLTPSRFFPGDEYWMRIAIREAARALEHDDVPVGAVLVHDGEVVGAGHNERELRQDPTAHAEMIAIRDAAARLGSWRLLRRSLAHRRGQTLLLVVVSACISASPLSRPTMDAEIDGSPHVVVRSRVMVGLSSTSWTSSTARRGGRPCSTSPR